MKVRVTTEVEAPDDATHYFGSMLSEPHWVKCTQIGVFGDHWWIWSGGRWCFLSHYRPYWLNEINQEDIINQEKTDVEVQN